MYFVIIFMYIGKVELLVLLSLPCTLVCGHIVCKLFYSELRDASEKLKKPCSLVAKDLFIISRSSDPIAFKQSSDHRICAVR